MAEDFKIQKSMGTEYFDIENDNGMKIKKGLFITTYTQKFTIDLSKAGEVINSVKVSYSFPKGITKSNADKKSSILNSTLTWNLGENDKRDIEYTVYSFNMSLIIIAVAVVILLIVFIRFIIIKKREKVNN